MVAEKVTYNHDFFKNIGDKKKIRVDIVVLID